MSPWRRSTVRLVRDVLPILVVGWIVFQVLRSHVGERYLVPSSSMEPTLHGSETHGDIVLVDKTAVWRPGVEWPRPLDLVVVRDRDADGPHHIVKRLVAVGPTAVEIEDGDVFVRDPATGRMERLVKHPVHDRGLRLRSFELEAPFDAALAWFVAAPDVWSLEGGTIALRAFPADALEAARSGTAEGVPLHLSTAQSIDTSFLASGGRRLGANHAVPRDIGFEVEIRLPAAGPTAVDLVVELFETCYALRYRVDGTGSLSRAGEAIGAPFSGPPLPIDRPVTVQFGYLDGRWFAIVGDRLVTHQDIDVPSEPSGDLVIRSSGAPRRANRFHVAVAGPPGTGLSITRFTGFHDVHYETDETSFELEEGQLFLLGDNAFDSRDSRERARDPYDRSDLVGRPVAVLAPTQRRRWL